MKIAALLCMKDEIELVGPAIAHLRAIGVDYIIASDARSTDGTAAVITDEARRAANFDLLPIDDSDPDPDLERRLSAEALEMARRAGATWLFFCDVDEFWLPATGTLRDCVAEVEADVLTVSRFNVPLTDAGLAMTFPTPHQAYATTLLYASTEDFASRRNRLRADPDAPWIASVPNPKVLVRTDRVASLGEGGHSAVAAAGTQVRTARPVDLLIAHVPFSTEARFARKVANIAATVAASGDIWEERSAWHWKRWLKNVAADGGVAAEMARNRISEAQLDALRREGVIRSVASLLTESLSDQPGGAR